MNDKTLNQSLPKSATRKPTENHQKGWQGENLVASWLKQQGWEILDQRWRCRWGELDIIAKSAHPPHPTPSILIFVEVKTRSQGNWDENGKLAINQNKQAKLWEAAQMFLSERPDFANYQCRFDVALVKCQKISSKLTTDFTNNSIANCATLDTLEICLGEPLIIGNYYFILQEYIEAAIVSNE